MTDGTHIGVTWLEGSSNGGSEVIDYKIWYALEADEYVVLDDTVTSTSYTTTVALTTGANYKFKVQARNTVGYSADSNEAIIMAAKIPDVPTDVATLFADGYIRISWTAPYNGGSPITGYHVQVRKADGVLFSDDQVNCNQSSAGIISDAQCEIPISVLRSSPFNLAYGDSVYARVNAQNAVGASDYSPVGNGGTIVSTPGAPLSFANN